MTIIDMGDLPLPPLPSSADQRSGPGCPFTTLGGIPALAEDPGNPAFFGLIGEDLPLMSCSVMHFRDGTVLRVRISHAIADGTAFSDFMTHWAACFAAAPPLAVTADESSGGAAPAAISANYPPKPPAPVISPAPTDDRTVVDAAFAGRVAAAANLPLSAGAGGTAANEHAVFAGELEKQPCCAPPCANKASSVITPSSSARSTRQLQGHGRQLQRSGARSTTAEGEDAGGGAVGSLAPLTSPWSPLGGVTGLIPAREAMKLGLRGATQAEANSTVVRTHHEPCTAPRQAERRSQPCAGNCPGESAPPAVSASRLPSMSCNCQFSQPVSCRPSSAAKLDPSMGFCGSGVGVFRVFFSRSSLATLKREAIISARSIASARGALALFVSLPPPPPPRPSSHFFTLLLAMQHERRRRGPAAAAAWSQCSYPYRRAERARARAAPRGRWQLAHQRGRSLGSNDRSLPVLLSPDLRRLL